MVSLEASSNSIPKPSVSLQRCANPFFASDYSHTLSRPPKRIAAEVCATVFRISSKTKANQWFSILPALPEMLPPCPDQKSLLSQWI